MTNLLLLPIVEGITCDECGVCCLHLGVPPFEEFVGDIDCGDVEWTMLPEPLQAEILAAWDDGRHLRSEPCLWFDPTTKRCRHYDLRPLTCMRFEPGNVFCMEMREGAGL